jgi:hypothetical protein
LWNYRSLPSKYCTCNDVLPITVWVYCSFIFCEVNECFSFCSIIECVSCSPVTYQMMKLCCWKMEGEVYDLCRWEHWILISLIKFPYKDWVDPVPDPLLLRKSGSAGKRTRDLWPLEHWD